MRLSRVIEQENFHVVDSEPHRDDTATNNCLFVDDKLAHSASFAEDNEQLVDASRRETEFE